MDGVTQHAYLHIGLHQGVMKTYFQWCPSSHQTPEPQHLNTSISLLCLQKMSQIWIKCKASSKGSMFQLGSLSMDEYHVITMFTIIKANSCWQWGNMRATAVQHFSFHGLRTRILEHYLIPEDFCLGHVRFSCEGCFVNSEDISSKFFCYLNQNSCVFGPVGSPAWDSKDPLGWFLSNLTKRCGVGNKELITLSLCRHLNYFCF